MPRQHNLASLILSFNEDLETSGWEFARQDHWASVESELLDHVIKQLGRWRVVVPRLSRELPEHRESKVSERIELDGLSDVARELLQSLALEPIFECGTKSAFGLVKKLPDAAVLSFLIYYMPPVKGAQTKLRYPSALWRLLKVHGLIGPVLSELPISLEEGVSEQEQRRYFEDGCQFCKLKRKCKTLEQVDDHAVVMKVFRQIGSKQTAVPMIVGASAETICPLSPAQARRRKDQFLEEFAAYFSDSTLPDPPQLMWWVRGFCTSWLERCPVNAERCNCYPGLLD